MTKEKFDREDINKLVEFLTNQFDNSDDIKVSREEILREYYRGSKDNEFSQLEPLKQD